MAMIMTKAHARMQWRVSAGNSCLATVTARPTVTVTSWRERLRNDDGVYDSQSKSTAASHESREAVHKADAARMNMIKEVIEQAPALSGECGTSRKPRPPGDAHAVEGGATRAPQAQQRAAGRGREGASRTLRSVARARVLGAVLN